MQALNELQYYEKILIWLPVLCFLGMFGAIMVYVQDPRPMTQLTR